MLVYGGFDRTRALVLNYVTQSTVILGGVVGFYLAGILEGSPPILLAFAAGNFIYVASSDLIPEIKSTDSVRTSLSYFLVFLLGILHMLSIKSLRGVVA